MDIDLLAIDTEGLDQKFWMGQQDCWLHTALVLLSLSITIKGCGSQGLESRW